jgi:hypothetical protein
MITVTRQMGDSEDDYLDDIDAPQNALFVHATLHTLLGKGLSAFIKVR